MLRSVPAVPRTRRVIGLAILALVAALLVPSSPAAAAPASSPVGAVPAAPTVPGWSGLGPNVYVFDPSMPQDQIQATVDAIAAQQVPNQFGSERYALLFKPGQYGSVEHPLSFQVGYYTEVAGLGQSPQDVSITGTINVYNQCFAADNCIALDNFWRSLSNLSIHIAGGTDCRTATEFWAVSQAAPMRRVQIDGGTTSLMDYCTAGPQYASGGFIADSKLPLTINGSQQQFLVRNSALAGWTNGVWNQVFAGTDGAPAQNFSENSGLPGGTAPYTTLATTPVTQEKPYLYDNSGQPAVFVPGVRRNASGTSWSSGATPGRSVPLSRFFVATPATSALTMDLALLAGKNLLLTPGVYRLSAPIIVSRPDTVVLGLGLATLIPQNGTAAVLVAAGSAKVSGLVIDAGPKNSIVLMQTLPVPVRAGSDPTLIQDVFFRIGGPAVGRATTSLAVGSSNTILDDIWAWRADHGTGVGWTTNTADTGVIVSGNDVTAYGLFVEHYQKRDVVWTGERGTTIFFQNEMPYDPPSQAAWNLDARTLGYPAFTVGSRVRTFTGYGMGSYCFFSQGVDIHATEAFSVPVTPGVQLHDILTRWLDGSGAIDSVVNGTGAAVTKDAPGPSDIVTYPAG